MSLDLYIEKRSRESSTKLLTVVDAKKLYDWLRTELKCCGYNSRSDWKQRVPDSCKTYKERCKDKFGKFVQNNLILIGGKDIGFALLQILGIAFACWLISGIRAQCNTSLSRLILLNPLKKVFQGTEAYNKLFA